MTLTVTDKCNGSAFSLTFGDAPRVGWQPLPIEEALSRTRPGELFHVVGGEFGVGGTPGLPYATIQYNGHDRLYTIRSLSTQPVDCDIQILTRATELIPLAGEGRFSPGTGVLIADSLIRLPANRFDMDPYVALRCPWIGLFDPVAVDAVTQGTCHSASLFGQYAAHTDIGPSRSSNQDGYFQLDLPNRVTPRGEPTAGTIFGVIDGMGGYGGGDLACHSLNRAFAYDLQAGHSLESAAGNAPSILEDAHQRALTAGHPGQNGAQTGAPEMGACFLLGEFLGREARFVHSGDSRGLILRNGQEVFSTKDHSLVQRLVDEGLISPEEAMLHPSRNIVTGGARLSGGRCGPLNGSASPWIPLQPGDRAVLASDPLWDTLSNEEVIARVSAAPSCEAAVLSLRLAIHDGSSRDNVTIIVYEHLVCADA